MLQSLDRLEITTYEIVSLRVSAAESFGVPYSKFEKILHVLLMHMYVVITNPSFYGFGSNIR